MVENLGTLLAGAEKLGFPVVGAEKVGAENEGGEKLGALKVTCACAPALSASKAAAVIKVFVNFLMALSSF